MVLDKETLEMFFSPEPYRNYNGKMEEGQNSFRQIQLVQLVKTSNRLEDLAFNTLHEDNTEQIKYISLYIKCLGLINQLLNKDYTYNFTKTETEKLNRLGVEDLSPAEARKELLNRLNNFDDVIKDAEIMEKDEKFIKE